MVLPINFKMNIKKEYELFLYYNRHYFEIDPDEKNKYEYIRFLNKHSNIRKILIKQYFEVFNIALLDHVTEVVIKGRVHSFALMYFLNNNPQIRKLTVCHLMIIDSMHHTDAILRVVNRLDYILCHSLTEHIEKRKKKKLSATMSKLIKEYDFKLNSIKFNRDNFVSCPVKKYYRDVSIDDIHRYDYVTKKTRSLEIIATRNDMFREIRKMPVVYKNVKKLEIFNGNIFDLIIDENLLKYVEVFIVTSAVCTNLMKYVKNMTNLRELTIKNVYDINMYDLLDLDLDYIAVKIFVAFIEMTFLHNTKNQKYVEALQLQKIKDIYKDDCFFMDGYFKYYKPKHAKFAFQSFQNHFDLSFNYYFQ